MRRPTHGHRLGIWLCGFALATGCSRYQARQDVPIVTSAPAKTPCTACASPAAAPRVEFDLQAVKSDLAIVSPYCPVRRMPVPDSALATPLAAGAQGVPGVCVIQTTYGNDGSAVVQQVGLVTEGTLPDGLPPAVKIAAQVLPETPPLHVPAPQLGFEETAECCSACTSAPQQRLVATPAGCAVPCNTCRATPACTTCNTCSTCSACNSTSTTTCATCNSCANGNAAAPATPAPPEPPPGVAIDAPTLFPRGELPPRRKSFVDITASPCFGHAANYSWLSGQVEYSRILSSWRLRYASVDETDRFAGSVTLVENAHVGYLRDGEYVRVEGHLVNPSAEGLSPAYRIESFKVIDNRNSPSATPSISLANAE